MCKYIYIHIYICMYISMYVYVWGIIILIKTYSTFVCVCVLYMSVCVWCVHVCVSTHGDPGLMSGIILNHYPTLFTEAWSLCQTQILCQNSPVLSGDSLSLPSKAGVADSHHAHWHLYGFQGFKLQLSGFHSRCFTLSSLTMSF